MTSPEGIGRWSGPDAGPVLPAESDAPQDGRYRVRLRMLDGGEHESRGAFLGVDPPRRVAMRWQWNLRGDDSGKSRVEIDLSPIDQGTELTLTRSRPSRRCPRQPQAGWPGAIDKRAALFAGA